MRKPAYNICHTICAKILSVVSQHMTPFKECMPNNPAAGDYNDGGRLRVEEASTAGDEEGVTVTSERAIVSQGKSVEITNRFRHTRLRGRKKVSYVACVMLDSTCGVSFY